EDCWYFLRVAGTFKERAGFHGCQMPEQLLGRIVLSSSNPGDVVMDPFAGSCTTLTVAKKKGRQFLGFEMSKEYVKLGNKRIDLASEGDDLEGSPEPKASAPATHSSKARRVKNAPRLERDFPLFMDLPEMATESDGIVEAFAKSNRGFSVDRIVADPILNEDFQHQCERRDIPGTPAERNRFLFRLRKSGRLKKAGIQTNKRTSFDWDHMDPFLFASEIAWKRVSELYANAGLDEILCDPRLATQFDDAATSLAEGYSPLEYRWAALKLRKQGSTGRRRAETMSMKKFAKKEWRALDDLDFGHLDRTPALYALRTKDDVLYAGETSNLRSRLKLQVAEEAIGKWPSDVNKPSGLSLAIREVETIGDSRLARQSHLLKLYRPKWNLNDFLAM
ncbi:MAG: DNA methyltransferase, partial [Planctomycetota bacterium]